MSQPFFETADVQLPDDNTVQVQRTFKATKDLVYRAYTEPQFLKRWLSGYADWEMTVCDMDVVEGGGYQWRWRNNAENQEFGFTGVFLKIIPQQEIQHTQLFDPGTMGGDMGAETIITVQLSESNGNTLVTTTIQYQSQDDRDMALSTGMTDGMEVNYKILNHMLKDYEISE